jgi:predicted RNase H-like HicB family nuclease
MLKVSSYPAILEPTEDGYSVYFPDLPGAISAGKDYEDAVKNAEECLSLHLYGMITDNEKLPNPSHMSEALKELVEGELAALIHPDVFGVQARQEDKAVRVNISFPKALLQAVDSRARQLGIDRSKLLQRAAREVVAIEPGTKAHVTRRRFKKDLPRKIINNSK